MIMLLSCSEQSTSSVVNSNGVSSSTTVTRAIVSADMRTLNDTSDNEYVSNTLNGDTVDIATYRNTNHEAIEETVTVQVHSNVSAATDSGIHQV